MTVVLEDQVKTIAVEIGKQFGDGETNLYFGRLVDIEDVVRSVIAQYDISGIARLAPSAASLEPHGTPREPFDTPGDI
jgi:hypothetical protein